MKEEKYLFFSVVVPAHNEEGYIDRTIMALKEMDYPNDKLEIIIVENGSTDYTGEIVKQLSPPYFKILSIEGFGVSKARNKGIEVVSDNSDWVIFLDADTYFGKPFLKELNKFLIKNKNKNLGCGMASVLPYPDSKLARGWYHFYNFANHVTKTTRSLQIIRRDFLKSLKYDEELTFGEDTKILSQCKKHSKHFYFGTKNVFSSTRRFQKNGWVKQLFIWIYLTALPYSKKKRTKYEAIR